MSQNLATFYIQQKDKFEANVNLLGKKLRWVSLFRIGVFVALVASLFYLPQIGWLIATTVAVVLLGLFLFLVKLHIQVEKNKKKNGILVAFCQDELKALNHEFGHFHEGEEFIDSSHDFSYDLDVFSEGSLFQFINRTSTISGQKTLAKWLQNPLTSKAEIVPLQEAVKEMAALRKWRMNFFSLGKLFEESEEQHKKIINWSVKKFTFRSLGFTKFLLIAIPFFTVLSLVSLFFGVNYAVLLIFVFLQWFAMYFYRKQIKGYFRFFSKKTLLIEKYKALLSEIEKQEFQSSWLKQQQSLARVPHSACKTIDKLGKLVRQFEYRQNILVGFILNSFFLWDIRCVYLLYKWQSENSEKLMDWLVAIENMDALISLANFADNHPGYAYPEINGRNFSMDAKELGHPLLNPERRVCSDFKFNKIPEVVIVTGANMAGKSTFLRAVGVNLVLAGIGAPVCAAQMNYTPMGIYTNMRTTDSLFKDESYFFAELKRLGSMLERLKKGEQLFVILDEMLKGTNSVDKLNGSKELVKKMVELQAAALIATHDLKLAEMEKEHNGAVVNKCFEIHIRDNELTFDYKLADGVTQSMNATFLMKKMGII